MNDPLRTPLPIPLRGRDWRRLAGRSFMRVAVPLLVAAGLWVGFIKWQVNSEAWARRTCRDNLLMIEGVKEQFALDHHLKPGAPVRWEDLLIRPDRTGYLRTIPKEPLGGTYTIDVIGVDPSCSTGAVGHETRHETGVPSVE